MNAPAELVTVYRSMDSTAKEDCEMLVDILGAQGIAAVVLDDEAPGVIEGTYEVRVSKGDSVRAEKLIAENPLPDEVREVNPSSALDLETVFHAEGGPMSELQAMGIKNLLESNGIAAVLIGDSVLPNFPFEVKVARNQLDQARQLIAEAEASEPEATETEQEP
jgi:hypothetical protein